jgi:hypothetical protein
VELAETDSAYSKAVRDPDDEMVLRTAGGTMALPRLAMMQPKYIVTNNTRDFKGANFYGFRVVTAHDFWQILIALDETLEGEKAG